MKHKYAFAAVIVLLVCGSAAGQQYGQWSWEATARAGQRSYENTLNGQSTNDYEQRDLRLFVGVNGFILHPAIASFSAAVETSASQNPSGSAADSDQLGFRLNLALLPEGVLPLQLYASRQTYDYQIAPELYDLGLYNVPERGSSFGGRFRVRGGLLRGLEASMDRTTIVMAGSEQRREKFNRDVLDWSRGSQFVHQHYRVERQLRSFAQNEYVLDDLLARVDEQGTFGRWRWNAFGNVLQREFSADDIAASKMTIGRMSALLASDNHDRPAWSFATESNYSGGSEYALTTHRAEARYTRPRVHGFQWSPLVSYMVQSTEDLRVQAPGVGLAANWNRRAGSFDFAATSGATFTRLTASGSDSLPSQNQFAFSAGVSVGHAGRLTKRFDASLSQNELRTSSTVENEPGFGSIGSAGTEDGRQMRVTVGGKVFGVTASLYSDWADRESNVSLPGKDFRTNTLMHSFQITARKFSVSGGSGQTEVTTDVRETIDFENLGVSLSPLSFLSTMASYRKDRRNVPYEPRIDGERLEAGASIRVGAIYLNPMAFWTTERFAEGQEREYRGFTMSISRHFGGFLPIVSVPKRRGTIQ